ncbi:MAG: ferredoxin [Candidatus Magasanikbacteria bacterium]|nr:ferredoxin [Candidatus Magasanikbacteria bacterium]MBT4071948.1 ferredoxin [Candidatus Magasanikbacteria bacterium]
MGKVTLNQDDCISCAACTIVAPDHYDMDNENGKAQLTNGKCEDAICKQDMSEGEVDIHTEAAGSCPMSCIHVFGEDGKELS